MPREKEKKKKHHSSSMIDAVLKTLGCTIFLKPSKLWLDTGSPELNAALGSEKYGLPSGKMYEIQGMNHAGKTALVMFLAMLAQILLNAFVIWIDAENSLENESDEEGVFENSWAKKFKLNTEVENFYRVYPKVLIAKKQRKKGKKITKTGDQFIQSAESLFDETEAVMKMVKAKDKERPIFIALDSIANLQTSLNTMTDNDEKNMRTNLDRAIFLAGGLPRMLTLIGNYTGWAFLINQIRTKQGMVFGDPEYSPGGKALEHNCHVRAKMRPYKKGVIEDDSGDVIGIRGSINNIKNKAGGGSRMGMKCGYHVDFKKRGKKMWSFNSIEELKKEK